MSTTVRLTGWVQGRNHVPTPIEITGHPLPYDTITEVRVSCYFPKLVGHEVVFHLDSCPKDDFTIGSAVVLTVEEPQRVKPVEVPVAVVNATPVVTTQPAAAPPASTATVITAPVDSFTMTNAASSWPATTVAMSISGGPAATLDDGPSGELPQ